MEAKASPLRGIGSTPAVIGGAVALNAGRLRLKRTELRMFNLAASPLVEASAGEGARG